MTWNQHPTSTLKKRLDLYFKKFKSENENIFFVILKFLMEVFQTNLTIDFFQQKYGHSRQVSFEDINYLVYVI